MRIRILFGPIGEQPASVALPSRWGMRARRKSTGITTDYPELLSKMAFCSATVLLATGCSTAKYAEKQVAPFDLARSTEATRAHEFAHEQRAHSPSRPRIGLALSGGGTKAAMYAHGVLHGLDASGLLPQVDIISSVSGGSYAAYWYFTKRMAFAAEGKGNYRDIFKDCVPAWYVTTKPKDGPYKRVMDQMKKLAPEEGKSVCSDNAHWAPSTNDPYRWQAHLVRWPDLFAKQITVPTGNKQGAPVREIFGGVLSALMEIPVGLVGGDSVVPRQYQVGIEQTWGLNPAPRTDGKAWRYTNGVPAEMPMYGTRLQAQAQRWDTLAQLHAQHKDIPLWIVNTTEGQKDDQPNMNNLWEITPYGYGSSRWGMVRQTPSQGEWEMLSTAVRASAGFADHQGWGHQTGARVLRWISLLVPAAEWGVNYTVETPGKSRRTLRLSDGGGSDNLGLMALGRRGLDDIIVVDAAQDDNGVLEDLCWIRTALAQEGLTLTFRDALQNFEEVCEPAKGKDPHGYNVSDWRNPVVQGEIRWPAQAGQLPKITRVWVLKPAWKEADYRERFNEPSKCTTVDECTLALFWGHNGGSAQYKTRRPQLAGAQVQDYLIFPQHGTVGNTANSSTYLFWAYRALGRSMAKHLRYQDGRVVSDLPLQIQPMAPL